MPQDRELDRKIGAAMRSLRKRCSMSDSEVADRMGYGPNGRQQIHRWERGERAISAGRLLLYLRAIGASFNELEGALDPPRPSSRRLEEISLRLRKLADSTGRRVPGSAR